MIGAITLAIAGALLPWAHTWRPGYGWTDVSGFAGSGDGGLVFELMIVAGIFTWSERISGSRLAFVVAVPALLGVACAAVLRLSYESLQTTFRLLRNAGGHGTIEPGFWMAVIGIIVVIASGAAVVWRARHRLSFTVGISGPTVAGAIGGVAGFVVGFVAGSTIAGLFTEGAISGVSTSVLVILAFTLAFVGAWVGAVGGASIARSTRRR